MRPRCWLGAPSPGGLALPDASPAPSRLYAPRGVFLSRELLVVADTGNHRVLLWHGVPGQHARPADVVLGQEDFYSEGPNRAGSSVENGFNLPTAVGVWDGRLLVADAWHHRILVWHAVPNESDTPPDYAIGQDNLASVEPNRGASVSREGLYCPYGMDYSQGRFLVCDTSNRRILGWDSIPDDGQPPRYLLGQPGWSSGEENRGIGVGPRSFRWPHAITRLGRWTYIADAGNHRVLGWEGDAVADRDAGRDFDRDFDRDADVVLGQPDFETAFEFAYRKQGPASLRFPYAISSWQGGLLVGDTANNRLLYWRTGADGAVLSSAAEAVVGQPDFDANGENRWLSVTPETLCWPYGVSWYGDTVAVADSGNNRVMLWEAPQLAPSAGDAASVANSPHKEERECALQFPAG